MEIVLKETRSRCPVCQSSCPATVCLSGRKPQKVFLLRTCAEHGTFDHCISSDARFYWLSKGGCCGGGACSAGDNGPAGTLGGNADPGDALGVQEKLSTCLALIEIVNSCNLECPTCFAASPRSSAVDAVPKKEIFARVQGVIDRKGKIEILQLSGGEPTIHPDFFEILEWCQAHPKIDYVLLNTNGVRLATDAAFAEALTARFRYGKFQLYLQFDGTGSGGQRELRGGDLRATRLKCLDRCAEIPVTLAMTVTPANLETLWETVAFGLTRNHIRGVSFQPEFGSGRTALHDSTRLNVADVILGLVEQSGGVLKIEDFTPLPCGDPNCATIGYLLRTEAGIRSISDFIDFSDVQGFLRDRVKYSLEDLAQCGCESEPLGAILKELEIDERSPFRLFIKPFMDAWSWDEDRIDRCCTHVIRPDGKLDSFCRYYAS